MNSPRIFSGIILTLVMLGLAEATHGQTLDEKLAPLNPLVNKSWEGMMKAPDGSAEWKTVCKYEAIWAGKVVRYTRSTPDRNGHEEGFIYWDDTVKKIAFFSIHSSAVFQQGFVSADKQVITFEGTMTWPAPSPNPQVKQTYDFKNTFEVSSESRMIDKWFMNAFGPWRPGHVIEFRAAQ